MGHPPFGHVGEQELKATFDLLAGWDGESSLRPEQAARGGFEGNAQTFRILTNLAARMTQDPGLNLTCASLDACVKYPRRRVHGTSIHEKWCIYPQDVEDHQWMRGERVGMRKATPFEAQLMDWCDDVTYAIHDTLDFYRAGFIPLDRLFERPRGRGRISADAERFLEQRVSEPSHRSRARRVWRHIGDIAELFTPWAGTRQIRGAMQGATSQLISYFMGGLTFEGAEPCRYVGNLLLDPDARRANDKRIACDLLKGLIWVYVIEGRALASQQIGQRQIVRFLLLEVFGEHGRLLPADRAEELSRHGDALRASSDYVASLTEQDALALYARLTGVQIGALTDTF
jgi:dGTPase